MLHYLIEEMEQPGYILRFRTNHVLATEHAHCMGGASVKSAFTLCGHVGACSELCVLMMRLVCVCRGGMELLTS